MEISEEQYRRIEPVLPRQRGNVSLSNLTVLNASCMSPAGLQVAWAAAPLRELAHHLHPEPLVEERRAGRGVRKAAERATGAHPSGGGFDGLDHREGASGRHGGVKKNGPQAIGKSRGGWSTKVHLVAANARTAITFALSPGQVHDAPQGRDLLSGLGPLPEPLPLLMDSAYEDDQTRQLALDFGWIPVVPPRKTRLQPWEYDRLLPSPQRSRAALPAAEGLPAHLLAFDKLDVMYLAFLQFALIVEALQVNRP